MSTVYVKDPAAILDYSIDWSAQLGDETIDTSTWTVPAGITGDDDSNTTTVATIRLSGGTAGSDYEIKNHIVTSGGQEDERTIIIQVRSEEYIATVLIATPGGTTSNSYVTLAEAKTYFLRKLYTSDWDAVDDDRKETALLMACQRLEQEDYVGILVDEDQALKWPRMKDDSGDLIRNYAVNAVPQPMKNAQCELALWYLQNTNAITVNPEAIGSIKIGNSVEIRTATNLDTSTLLGDVDFAGLPMTAAQFLKGLRLYSVLA